MSDSSTLLTELNERSREVFRRVVEGYLRDGEPIGSRTLTRAMSEKVSAATIRNVMQDLEYMGLLAAPHVSAGRVPTQMGLRLFVDGLLEVDDLTGEDRSTLEASLTSNAGDVGQVLDTLGSALSGVTQGASLVLAPKHEAPIRHIEFVSLTADRALVVLVFADGHVENRVFQPPLGQTPSSMREAANFVNALAAGLTLSELGTRIRAEISRRRQEIDVLARDMVESGLAMWENEGQPYERLIVRGRSNLIGEADAAELDRIKTLFDDLERKRDIASFLDLTEQGEGVRIFIGSENKLFSLSGSSLVVSPYMNADRKIIGAVGVIGPTRLNYGRIVPIVNYTAQLVGRVIADRGCGRQMAEPKREDLEAFEETTADSGPMPEAELIDITDDAALEDPSEELIAARAERDEAKDRMMRALAEAENVRKRAERDRREAEQYGGSRLARDLLPVFDNLKRALDAVSDEQREVAKGLIEGVELTQKELVSIFAKHGVTTIAPQAGDKFDPQMHQAMFEAPVPGTKAGDIIQVMAVGFMLHERLLRPAQVGVSSTPAS